MAKLLVYYNPTKGRYYCKYKALVYEKLPLVTSQGHNLVADYNIYEKDSTKKPFNYRLADFLEKFSKELRKR